MDSGATKQTVVLHPGAFVGHIGPMMQLAKVFLQHGYGVTMVLLEPPIRSSDSGPSFVEHIAASNPSITFHVLPPIPPPDFAASAKPPLLLILELMNQYNERLESFLRSIPRERLHSLVIDMFCGQSIDVATKLGVPASMFFASGAACLAVLTQLPALLAGRQTGLKELGDTPLEFLGVPPMPASHLIPELLDHPEESELCKIIMESFERSMDTHGVLINTFQSLEFRALQAFKDPLCVPGRVPPPVYAIGPLVAKGATDQEAERHDCLAWLDAQPERSVVFLCWGSKGVLSKEQIKEIAAGLEQSGHRFLWVVRTLGAAATVDAKTYLGQVAEPDLDVLMPEGFLERTKHRGLVVKSWAPQVDVLGHPATGAFLTHCGWNSTLEAIVAGVPMLCWPLAAEQMMNKVFLVDDIGVGVEMEGYMTGFIKAEEIAAKVRLVIDSDKGRELRERSAELKKEAEDALKEGGSSKKAFSQFLEDVKNITG